jgi:polysaccharide pyruvyl transferase WcaK-like protein
MQNSRILVIADAAGSGQHYHAGDEAMAQVALDRLEKIVGREQLVLACPHPKTAQKVYNIKAIYMPLRSLKTWILHFFLNPFGTSYLIARCLWYLYQADFVFKAGGGNIRGKHSKFPLLSLAGYMKKKILVVSQTIGPLRGKHRTVLQRQLAQALWIGVRDVSYSESQLGLPVHSALDDAVYLEPRHGSVSSRLTQEHSSMIGISFSGCKKVGEQVLNGLYRAMENVVVQLDGTAVFIPHHAPHGRGDILAAKYVTESWGQTKPVLLEHVPPAAAIMALTGALRLVISNRYHGVIFSLAMGTPVIGLYHDEYTEAKMCGAFEEFGLEPSVLSIADTSMERLSEMAFALVAREKEFKAAACNAKAEGLAANIAPYQLLRTLADV